jgi:hypothetical protein
VARNVVFLTRRLLLLAVCLVLAAPGVAGAQLTYHDLFGISFSDAPVDATSVKLCWGGSNSAASDSWTIRRAAGMAPPAPDAPAEAVIPGGKIIVCYTSTGLVTDAPYTFRITGHDASGESEPGIITAAARDAGSFVLYGDSSEKLARTGENDTAQLAVTARDRRWHAIFTRSLRYDYGTFYSTRAASGWTTPELITTSSDSLLASYAGTLAVAWNGGFYRARYRLRASGASSFGVRRTVPRRSYRDDVDAAALDRYGHLHLLFDRYPGIVHKARLLYVSKASGHWREQRLASIPCEYPCYLRPPRLTYDSVTDRLVAVDQYKDIKIATKRASAESFGAFRRVRAANKLHLFATGLTSRNGRVTLGLESHFKPATQAAPAEESGPLYVMTGRQLIKVPSTSASDSNLLVAASSPARVLLAWQRASASWDPSQQGLWTAESVRDPETGRWSIGSIQHRTASHYDRLTSLTVTATGDPLIAYTR